MITIRRSSDRTQDRRRAGVWWRTFRAHDGPAAFGDGFGILLTLDEVEVLPGAVLPRMARRNAEVVQVILEGGLAFEDTDGVSGVVGAGEVQRSTLASAVRVKQANASRTESLRLLRLMFRPVQADVPPSYQSARFSAAERRGVLRPVVATDGRQGALRLGPDAIVFWSLFVAGQHLARPLAEGRAAWLQVVTGALNTGDSILSTGDGAGFVDEPAVSMRAQEASEVLLIEVPVPIHLGSRAAVLDA